MVKAEQFAHNMKSLFTSHGLRYIETLYNIGFMGVFNITVEYMEQDGRTVKHKVEPPFQPQTEDEIYNHITTEAENYLKGRA